MSNFRDLRVGEEGLQEGHSITAKFLPVQGSDAFRVKLKSKQCRQYYYQVTNTLVWSQPCPYDNNHRACYRDMVRGYVR